MNKNRMTIQKRIILEELGRTKKHPTADTLYYEVKKRLPEISKGTVYRNLEILTRNGKARKIIDSKRKNRFDGNPEMHFHIECVNCGRVDDIDQKKADVPQQDIGLETDYDVTGYNIHFYGICPDCKQG
jgi:Fur family transcriptional regulator, ferric uptake regulator